MFHHFTINCIWLILFLHELKQVLVLVKHFSFINRNVSLKQIGLVQLGLVRISIIFAIRITDISVYLEFS